MTGNLSVRNLGKTYKRYTHKWGRLAEWLGAGIQHEKIPVLIDVNFDVRPGEAVGIIGLNGAGKSTLLKIISGTTKATTGKVDVQGRISALLELGMGFHPDFTGRQNVQLAGHLRGMNSVEIIDKMTEIERFAEIGDYIDQPVRVYSSGMMVRLAFSVATAVRPEILVVDEALSVGDTFFQHKSFDRIRQFRNQGTTLLFVSHSPGSIKALCDRAILLDHGSVLRDGVPDEVLDYYNAVIAKQRADYEIIQVERESGHKVTRSGGGQAVIDAVELIVKGQPVRALQSGSAASIHVCAKCCETIEEFTVGILIRDRFGNDIFGTNSYHHKVSRSKLSPGDKAAIEFFFPQFFLGRGSYSLTVALHSGDNHLAANYDWWDRALVFQVVSGNTPQSIGVCDLPVRVSWLPNL